MTDDLIAAGLVLPDDPDDELGLEQAPPPPPEWDRLIEIAGKHLPGLGMFGPMGRAALRMLAYQIGQDPEGSRAGLVEMMQEVAAALSIRPDEVFPGAQPPGA